MAVQKHHNIFHHFIAFFCALGMMFVQFSYPAHAQQQAAPQQTQQGQPAAGQDATKPAQGNAVGGGWQAQVASKAPDAPVEMDAQTIAFVQQISDYFNGITDMKGDFVQTNPDNQNTNGIFYVKRPGRLRFDYADPSKLKIISDGKWLSVEDHEAKSFDRYPLDSTPFKILLAEKVDLLNNSKVVSVAKGKDMAVVTVADKKDDSSGQLKLFFSIPELQLKEWVITDPQGLDTRIQISKMILDETIPERHFVITESEVFKPN